MKKSLVALAALAALTAAGAASAQSSVTLFGVVDAAVQYRDTKTNSTGKAKTWSLGSGGINTSRLGFRGVEDLGGGLAASFWLEAGFNSDTGTGQGSGGSFSFNRRSTVSLSGGFGEIRLGRDFSVAYLNTTNFDPFGTNGVGTSLIDAYKAGFGLVGGAPVNDSYPRTSNAISYYLPANLGGFYGQVQYAFAEKTKVDGFPTNNADRNIGGRFGYANGPLDVAVAYDQTDLALTTGGYDLLAVKELNLAASYDFGVAKLFGEFVRNKIDNDFLGTTDKATGYLVGATAPLGAGLLRASYSQIKLDTDIGSDPLVRKAAVGYVHNLSKRTALYTTYAHTFTKRLDALKGNGFDVGIRHSF
jgi:predicted porin